MLLAGLQAAGHTVLVDTAAAIGQAAVTAVQLCAGHIHIAAAIHQQVLPLTDVAQFICNEELPLHRVPALVTQLTAVSRTELHLPHDRLLMLLHLEEIPISHHPFFLLEGAGDEVNEREPEDDAEDPALP